MSKVTLTGHIIVSEKDLPRVQEALPKHIKLTREESGCLHFEVTQDLENPHRFVVREIFIDSVAFRKHQQRVRNSSWGKISANVERHYKVTGLSDCQ